MATALQPVERSGLVARGPLYMIAANLRILLEEIAAADGEITPQQEEALTALNVGVDTKVESIALILKELDAEDAMVDAAVEQLIARKEAISAERDRLEKYLMRCMEEASVDKVKGKLAGARISLNPPKVVVDLANPAVADEESLLSNVPPKFIRIVPEKVTPSYAAVDKDAVKEAWKAGEKLPEGITVVREKKLTIL